MAGILEALGICFSQQVFLAAVMVSYQFLSLAQLGQCPWEKRVHGTACPTERWPWGEQALLTHGVPQCLVLANCYHAWLKGLWGAEQNIWSISDICRILGEESWRPCEALFCESCYLEHFWKSLLTHRPFHYSKDELNILCASSLLIWLG